MARLAIRATGDGMREKVTSFNEESTLQITYKSRVVGYVVVRDNNNGMVHVCTTGPWKTKSGGGIKRHILAEINLPTSETHSA